MLFSRIFIFCGQIKSFFFFKELILLNSTIKETRKTWED